MSDAVSIANRALADAGTRSSIVSFDEGSNESNNVALIYVSARQQLLRAAHWGFAAATATLSLLKSAPGTLETPAFPTSGVWSTAYPPPPWLFEYAWPADCLQGRRAISNYATSAAGGVAPIFPAALAGQGSPFTTEPGRKFEVATDFDSGGNQIKVIVTNVDQALLSYTRDISVEALWDSLFEEAMVAALAAKLCWALSGDKARSNTLVTLANQKIMVARAADANESMTIQDHTPDWIVAHGIRAGQLRSGDWFFPYGSVFSSF